MDLQDLAPAFFRREVHLDPAVKAAGTEQRLIQEIRPVGGANHQNSDPVVHPETVHLHQQLVEGLVVLQMGGVFPPFPAQDLKLVEENDSAVFPHFLGQPAGSGEKLPDPLGPDPGIHLNKLGTGSGQKDRIHVIGGRLGHQGLPGPGRAGQQYPFQGPDPQRLGPFFLTEKIEGLHQFPFGRLLAADIGKADMGDEFFLTPAFQGLKIPFQPPVTEVVIERPHRPGEEKKGNRIQSLLDQKNKERRTGADHYLFFHRITPPSPVHRGENLGTAW